MSAVTPPSTSVSEEKQGGGVEGAQASWCGGQVSLWGPCRAVFSSLRTPGAVEVGPMLG